MPPLVLEVVDANRHLMSHAIPFTNKARASDWSAVDPAAAQRGLPAVQLLAQSLQAFDGLSLQSAVGKLLDAVGQAAFKESAIERRRLLLEELAPHLLQVFHGRGLQCSNPGYNAVSHWRSPWWSGRQY